MSDDFKDYIKNIDNTPKATEKKKKRNDKQQFLLGILVSGFIFSCIYPVLFVLWVPYLIFIFIYASREWMG